MRRSWIFASAGLVTAGALLGTLPQPSSVDAGRVADTRKDEPGKAAERLRQTLESLNFQEVLDTAPPGSAQARSIMSTTVDKEAHRNARRASVADPKPIVQQPQVDATVIELDRRGRPVSSGTALMSPLYPKGVAVPVDGNLSTKDVRWRQWDDKGWYANKGQGTLDVVPGRENAPVDHMLNYPASVLKLIVNFGVLRLVDQGKIKLDSTYDYRPTASSSLCGGPTSKTVGQYMDESITFSSNPSSCALVKLLHDRAAIDPLNQVFQDLGLETLQLKGTNPANGGRWSNSITMSSLDTAKLLVLVNGAKGAVWTAPNGKPVTSDVLRKSSRKVFMAKLAQQGFNDMLSTPNRCGGDYPGPGIPHATPERWIDADGTANVQGTKFGRDVRPCNAQAEVTFAHKTGWVNNTASDAGVVKALPGKDGRSYVVVVFSNLGTQYIDAGRPAVPPGVYPYAYTKKFAQLGRAVDAAQKD
ncbi:serine hydrolase [Spirillospora sp. CA-294931]|uniref:serine hydrolase n=1 Tax=Spirillospora sp. CA-294931 TaxID=3240042 RepID=UPI003D8E44F4